MFSSWQAANYPVYLAASPGGDLYVASDGNGSLGRDSQRGRVLRLRDTDNDGRADQVTEFVKEIDSPRGMVWDHDRLYLLHPPHVSVFFDRDQDGVAEDSKKLIDGIAFGFADRPADHTTNGLDIGIDGWIYVAGGDFGFLKATGSDGRTLQHRGGGVIRFRPDGAGMELFATGTRNILGTPVSPLLDIFARDNTNDGGGWDVRFHHFSGLEDHGYPRLYKNFAAEHVAPLADYGGGSGCGSVYLSEPGIPGNWNNAPMTCDWGTGALWKHRVERVGGSFRETAAPEKFIALPRPTDAGVDGLSRIYQASWKGPATFKWAGPDTGFIVQVSPKGFQPGPLPDFEKLSDGELVDLIASTKSQVRRIAAQRTLLRRDFSDQVERSLLFAAKNDSATLPGRVAALFTLALSGADPEKILPFVTDKKLAPFVFRALGDFADLPPPAVASGLNSDEARTRLETLVALARRGQKDAAPQMAAVLGDADPVVAHTAFRALALLGDPAPCFAALTSPDATSAQRQNASFALMRMHQPEVIDEAIALLAGENRSDVRRLLFTVLARLYHREAEWKGNSWGTRPDTRGPYYEPATWELSEKILTTLKKHLNGNDASEAAFLVKEMSRNRIHSDDALTRILSLAKDKPDLIPQAVAQLSQTDTIPGEGVDLLASAIGDGASSLETVSQAIQSLARVDGRHAFESAMKGFLKLETGIAALKEKQKAAAAISDPVKSKSESKYAKSRLGAGKKALETAASLYFNSPKLENHHLALEELASVDSGSSAALWSNAGLLALASRKNGSPESREMSQKAIEEAWRKRPEQRIDLIRAAAATKNRYLESRIQVAMNSPDPATKQAAMAAAKLLKINKPGSDQTPKIGSLGTPQKAIVAVLKEKGDPALGEAVFSRATCAACHTVSQGEAQKGPYLGNIAQTYNREQLTEAIIDPGKTIAQGFKTNVFSLENGSTLVGFVTSEAGDAVTLRDIAANEYKIAKSEIAKRDTLPASMMPPGLVNSFSLKEVASLVDYLVMLGKNQTP